MICGTFLLWRLCTHDNFLPQFHKLQPSMSLIPQHVHSTHPHIVGIVVGKSQLLHQVLVFNPQAANVSF